MKVKAKFVCKCGTGINEKIIIRPGDSLWEKKPACPVCARRMRFKGAERI